MMKIVSLLVGILLAFFLTGCATLETLSGRRGDETIVILREDGMQVILPEAGGPGTYGTFLIPKALAAQNPWRYMYRGNALQMNFVPGASFPREFASLGDEEKLRAFLQFESQFLQQQTGGNVELQGERSFRSGGVSYRRAVMKLTPRGENQTLAVNLIARTAGNGILHGGWQVLIPQTASSAEPMVRRMLASFELVPRPLSQQELVTLSQAAQRSR